VHKVTEVLLYTSDSMLVTMHRKAAWSFFELPFLSTHRTKLIHLLRVEPFYNAVNMEAV